MNTDLAAVMPPPHVYEREYSFWPWGKLLTVAVDLICTNALQGGVLVDYMCGTGFLLNEIASRRPDLFVIGCDNNQVYVEYGRCKYPNIRIVEADARSFDPPRKANFAVCTAGLHHLSLKDQPMFLTKVKRDLGDNAFFLVGEEFIRDHEDENSRKKAVLELFSELMSYLEQTKAPLEVVEAAADTFVNDWCERGEYKISKRKLETMLAEEFEIVTADPIWADNNGELGDWLLLCKPRTTLVTTE